MRIAMLHTRLRVEERMLLDALANLNIDVTPLDARKMIFNPAHAGEWQTFDAVIDRSLSLTTTLTCTRILEHLGVRCINPLAAVERCADKLATSLALIQHDVPTPGIRVALDPDTGSDAIEQLGYPAVLKPTVGSWGRLVARVNDRDAAEALLEHRATLGSPHHGVVYAQQHIEKPGRDIRVFVVGGNPIAAIARHSTHWITNTARGATTTAAPIDGEIAHLAACAARALGGDLLAIDILECPHRGPLVNEVNHSMEFRNSIEPTGVDIPAIAAQHIVAIAETRAAPHRHHLGAPA